MPAFTPVQHNLTYTETYNKRDSKIYLRHKWTSMEGKYTKI